MNHKERIMSLLTVDLLVENMEDILTEMWEAPPERDNEAVPNVENIGGFKKVTGFYASKKFMKEMMDAFIGRLSRHYFLRYPDTDPEVIMDVFFESEENEWTAIERLKVIFTKKYGPVSEERVKELDELGEAIRIQNGQKFANLIGEKHGPIEA